MARPTSCTPDIIEKAEAYVDGGWKEAGHAIPSAVGLCSAIERARSTVYGWAEDKSGEFSDILERINEEQELTLLNMALIGEYNANIAKLALGKHGYHEKQQTELTGKGGGPIETRQRAVFVPVGKKGNIESDDL